MSAEVETSMSPTVSDLAEMISGETAFATDEETMIQLTIITGWWFAKPPEEIVKSFYKGILFD